MVENTPAPADLVEQIIAVIDENVSGPHLHGNPDLKKAHEQDKRTAASKIVAQVQAHMASDGDAVSRRDWALKISRQYESNDVDAIEEGIARGEFIAAHRRAAATAPQPDPRDAVEEAQKIAIQNAIADGATAEDINVHRVAYQYLLESLERTALANSEPKP